MTAVAPLQDHEQDTLYNIASWVVKRYTKYQQSIAWYKKFKGFCINVVTGSSKIQSAKNKKHKYKQKETPAQRGVAAKKWDLLAVFAEKRQKK